LQWTFGQVEQVLACTHSIRDDRRSAFSNRLKNYQKAGFPAGINTGRGRAATYQIGHLLQMGLALELSQLGLNPERALEVIQSDMHSVAMSLFHSASDGPPDGEFTQPYFIYFDPAGLSDLMIERQEDRAVGSFFYAGLGQMKDQLENWSHNGLGRISLLNVSALLWNIGSYAAYQLAEVSPAEVYEAVKVWASPYIHNEPYYDGNPEA
jgi:hypothetical protein